MSEQTKIPNDYPDMCQAVHNIENMARNIGLLVSMKEGLGKQERPHRASLNIVIEEDLVEVSRNLTKYYRFLFTYLGREKASLDSDDSARIFFLSYLTRALVKEAAVDPCPEKLSKVATHIFQFVGLYRKMVDFQYQRTQTDK